MSLESNKADFEKALDDMVANIGLLDACVDECIMNTLNAVINEYEGHLKDDIQEAIDKLSEVA